MRAYGLIGTLGSLILYGLAFAIPASREFAASWAWPALVAGYAAFTAVLIGWMSRAAKGSPMRFVAAVNGATAAKLLVSASVVAVYLVAKGPHPVPFALGLFAAFAWNTARFVWVSQTLNRPSPAPSAENERV